MQGGEGQVAQRPVQPQHEASRVRAMRRLIEGPRHELIEPAGFRLDVPAFADAGQEVTHVALQLACVDGDLELGL